MPWSIWISHNYPILFCTEINPCVFSLYMLSGYHSLPCYSYIFFLFLVIVILLLSLLLLLVQHCDYCRLSFSGSRSSFFPRSLPSFSSPFFSLLSTPHSSPCSLFPILLFTLSYPFFFLLIQSHTHKKIVLLFSLPCLPPLFLPLSPYPAPPTLPPHPLPPFPLCVKESNGMFYGEERMERPPPNISCPSHAFTQYSIANV